MMIVDRNRSLMILLLFVASLQAASQDAPGTAGDPVIPKAVEALRQLNVEKFPIETDSGGVSWSTGTYLYDPAGNIIVIGSQYFLYDPRGRLVGANVTAAAGSLRQNYSYDVYGNMTEIETGGVRVAIPTDGPTNHLTTPSVQYDAAGNMTQTVSHGDTITYKYDGMNMLQHVTDTRGNNIAYVYTADDQRVWDYDLAANISHWTIRDLEGNVLRDYRETGSGWSLAKDYFYRDGLLLAAAAPGGVTTHFSLDQVGTPRLITDQNHNKVGFHVYFPFGTEWYAVGLQESPAEIFRFTGQQRDKDLTESGDYLDYMHARFFSGTVGRFTSVDPVLNAETASRRPQMWNRYSYVMNNPLNAVDPSGAQLISLTGQNTLWTIAGNAAANITFRQDGSIDTTNLTQQDLSGNEGALLLQQMALSSSVYTYEEGTTSQSAGGPQNVSGVLNLDDNPTDIVLPNGNAMPKGPGRFPVAGVNGAVTVDPSVQYKDAATGSKQVPTHAIAFHELAESYAKVEQNIMRGPDNGPGAHQIAKLREVILMMQRPNWTPYPAGGQLKR
jgi:RHS repeat-associated protein